MRNTFILMVAAFLPAMSLSAAPGQARGWGYEQQFAGSRAATLPSLTTTAKISGDSNWSIALTEAGEIVTWGNNTAGKQNSPSGVFLDVAGRFNHGVAIAADGSLVAWGSMFDGPTAPPNVNNAVQVAAGDDHAAVLLADGTVLTWGGRELVTYMSGMITDAVEIACGWYHVVVRHSDGTVSAWGHASQSGQWFNPPENAVDVVKVSASQFCSYAIKADGTVVAWGMPDTYGHLSVTTPNAVDVQGGRYHTIVLTADGHLEGFGTNPQGQLNLPAGTFRAIGAGRYYSQAIEGIPGPAPQLVFYVDNDGDDSSDGKIDYPFRTIQRGIDAATEPLSRVVVAPGVYTDAISTSGFDLIPH